MKRRTCVDRSTKETSIRLELDLDGQGESDVKTGIGFFDHMLTLLSFYSGCDLKVEVNGDLEVDNHHTLEDIGISLGRAVKAALGDKKGIRRYGSSYLPMDEALIRTVLDFSGRAYLVYMAEFKYQYIGQMDVQDVKEFFRAFAFNAEMTLHVEVLYGDNQHHIVEAMFKGLGLAIKEAIQIESSVIPSTKGVL
jgi:imidazoleglycerol-phosphate dehydratase